jgi:hypothetical protein
MTNESTESMAADIQALEEDIETTRSSLARKVDEIGRRLQPDEVKAELKHALRRRLDPEPYVGWIATTLIALGSVMIWRGWPRARDKAFAAGNDSMPGGDDGSTI